MKYRKRSKMKMNKNQKRKRRRKKIRKIRRTKRRTRKENGRKAPMKKPRKRTMKVVKKKNMAIMILNETSIYLQTKKFNCLVTILNGNFRLKVPSKRINLKEARLIELNHAKEKQTKMVKESQLTWKIPRKVPILKVKTKRRRRKNHPKKLTKSMKMVIHSLDQAKTFFMTE